MSSYSKILVGTDGSASSFRAVEKAAVLAADTGATLLIASAYQPLSERDRTKASQELGDAAYKVLGANPAEEALRDAKAIATKSVQDRIKQDAGVPMDTPLKDIEPMVKAEIAKWADVIKRAKIPQVQ